ncbi:YccF domain-containing protein [Caulobacter sp. ErkDOM-YI]|uniref:YccF domain-containing protein n=1 Tax=unclassified Caulobacter TaxID=2648921 RepID=UPI003AF4C1F1
MIRLILNILWFVFGGWISGLLWLLGGALLAITIVGLPYTGAAWRIAGFAFWPFGKEIVSREIVNGKGDLGTGPLGFVLNIIWFILGGWYIALSHLMIAFAEAITIIGIPFAIKDFQLALIALAPIGREVVVVRR